MREMTKAADKTTKSSSGDDHFSLSTLGLDLLDTSWRIAVPVLLFAGAGIFADNEFGSGPLLTLLGSVIGFGAAFLLLKEQLRAVEREDRK